MQDKFAEWRLDNPLDRSEAYRWACIAELQELGAELKAIRKLLEDKPQKK